MPCSRPWPIARCTRCCATTLGPHRLTRRSLTPLPERASSVFSKKSDHARGTSIEARILQARCRARRPCSARDAMIGEPGSGVTSALCRHGWMAFPTHDSVIGRALAKYGEWAEHEIRFLSTLVGAAGTVLDVGAYVGTHTLALAHVAARVYAFEPQPGIFALLRANVERNGLANVQLVHAAVSRSRGDISVPPIAWSTGDNFGAFSLAREASSASRRTGESVRVVAIDDLDLTACDLIKVDVEGLEPEVLEGA